MAVFAQHTHAPIHRRVQNIGAVIRIIYVVVALWYAPTTNAQSQAGKANSTQVRTGQTITDEAVRSIINASKTYTSTARPVYDYTKRGGIFPPDLEQERVNSLPLPLDSVVGFIRFWEIDSLLRLLDKRVFSSIEELTYTVIAPARNDYEKVWAIFRWLDIYVSYDRKVYENCDYDAEVDPDKILTKRSTICVGYARMFDKMCFYAGIPSRIINGTTSKPESYKPLGVGALERYGHVWNHVIIEGRRYFCDPTWKSVLTVFKFSGGNVKAYLSESESYFLRDPQDVSRRHHYDRVEDQLAKTPLHHTDRYTRFVPYDAGIVEPYKIQMEEKTYFNSLEKVRFDVLAPYKDEYGPITYKLMVYNHTRDTLVRITSPINKMFRNEFQFLTQESGMYSLTLFRCIKRKQLQDDGSYAVDDQFELMAQRVIVVGDTMPHLKSTSYCKEKKNPHKEIRLLSGNDSTMVVADSIVTLRFTAHPHYRYLALLSGNLQANSIDPIAEELKNGIYTITFRAPSLGEYTCTVHGYDTLAYARMKKTQAKKQSTASPDWQVVADVGVSFRKAPNILYRSNHAMLAVPQTEWLEHGKEVTVRFVMPDSVRNVRWVQNRENAKKREVQPIIVQNHVATIITTPDIAKGNTVWLEYEYYDTTERVMKSGGYYFMVGKRNEKLRATILQQATMAVKKSRASIGISAK